LSEIIALRCSPADGAKNFPLVGRHRVPGSDFAKRTDGFGRGLSEEFLSDLFLVPARNIDGRT